MLIALEFLEKSDESTLKKYENALSTWISKEMHEGLLKAINVHLPMINGDS